jgi:hypothetical protein
VNAKAKIPDLGSTSTNLVRAELLSLTHLERAVLNDKTNNASRKSTVTSAKK